MKRVALSMLATTLICASFLQSRDLTSNMLWEGNPWGFVENVFIIEPEREVNTILARIKRIGPGALVGSVTGYSFIIISALIFSNQNDRYNSLPKVGKRAVIACSAIGFTLAVATSSTIGFKVVKYYTRKHVDFNALKEFILEWQDNKAYTPKYFHKFFDALFEEYTRQKEACLQRRTPDIMRNIRRVIWEQFPKKYEQKLVMNGYSLSLSEN